MILRILLFFYEHQELSQHKAVTHAIMCKNNNVNNTTRTLETYLHSGTVWTLLSPQGSHSIELNSEPEEVQLALQTDITTNNLANNIPIRYLTGRSHVTGFKWLAECVIKIHWEVIKY